MTARAGTMLLILILAVLYAGSVNHLPLTDPDEVFYSQTAKEMSQQHSYLTPVIFGQPQFEKPPLFYWLLIAVTLIAGAPSTAARAVPALFGFLGVAATFFFCRRVFDREVAWIAGVLLATTSLYIVLSEAVLTDITLSVLMMFAFYAFYLWFLESRDGYLHAFGAAAALAVLTKGPVAILILLGTAVLFLAVAADGNRLRRFLLHPWVIVFAVLAVPWYAYTTARYGRAFVDEFIVRDNLDRILYAEHQNFDHWWFYPVTIVLGLFPWTFDLTLIGQRWRERGREHLFFLSWFVVTFAVFEIARSKLASYILPLVPSIVIPLAVALSGLRRDSKRMRLSIVLQAAAGLVVLAAPSSAGGGFRDVMTPELALGVRMLGASMIAGAVLMGRQRIMEAIATRACGTAAALVLVGMGMPPALDRAYADEYLKEIVDREHYASAPVVTERLYARGVYYNTGNAVVVMDHNPQPFWSPHPIEVLSTREAIMAFFAPRDRVLCVVKDTDAEELDRIFQGRRIDRRITSDGRKVVVMSERID